MELSAREKLQKVRSIIQNAIPAYGCTEYVEPDGIMYKGIANSYFLDSYYIAVACVNKGKEMINFQATVNAGKFNCEIRTYANSSPLQIIRLEQTLSFTEFCEKLQGAI